MKYQIIDWAGNICLYGFEFDSFYDAETGLTEFIEIWLGLDYEIERDEYYIVQTKD